MVERWAHLARLVTLQGEACAALALLLCRLPRDGGVLREIADRHRALARRLVRMASARGAPRHLKSAAKRHAETVARLLA